jgi:ABC-2 type transport system ATP-binding protein
VFLSSHLLSEIEQVATHIGIINQGQLIFQGTLQELQFERREHLKLGAFDPEVAIELLTQAGYTVTRGEEELILVDAFGRNEAAQINRTLVQSEQDVFHVTLEQLTLEDIFLRMTGPAQMEGALL